MKWKPVEKDLVGTEICQHCGTVQDVLSHQPVLNPNVWSMTGAQQRGAKVRLEKRCQYCENEK